MTSRVLSRGALLAAAGTLAVSLTACSGTAGGSSTGSAGSSPAGNGSSSGAAVGGSSSSGGAPSAGQVFGSACPQTQVGGPGSFAAMSTLPVGTAATTSPALSTLVSALQKAQLVETLNSTPNITVLAPANPAFQAIPADALDAVLDDTPKLTAVLTHHVIPGRLAPAQLAGQHTTVANDTVTIAGSGTSFTISGDQTISGRPASVICGNVQTANATVYIIDQVLAPTKTR